MNMLRTNDKRSALPHAVLVEAHRRYPKAVGEFDLYGVAFFGHGRPSGLTHKRTCEGIWRGLIRQCLREHAATAVKALREGSVL